MFTSECAAQLRKLAEEGVTYPQSDRKEYEEYIWSLGELQNFIGILRVEARNGVTHFVTDRAFLYNKYVISHMVKMGFSLSEDVFASYRAMCISWDKPNATYTDVATKQIKTLDQLPWRSEMDQFFTTS